MSKFLKVIVNIFLVCAILIAAAILVPPVLGITTTIVDTTDMNTNLPQGSITYSQDVNVTKLVSGNEILKESDTKTYAYIIEEGDASTGKFKVLNATDKSATAEEITLRNSVSKVMITIPYIGYVVMAMHSMEGILIIGLVVLFMIILFILSELWKKRPDEDEEDEEDTQVKLSPREEKKAEKQAEKEAKQAEKDARQAEKDARISAKEAKKAEKKTKKKAGKKQVDSGDLFSEEDENDTAAKAAPLYEEPSAVPDTAAGGAGLLAGQDTAAAGSPESPGTADAAAGSPLGSETAAVRAGSSVSPEASDASAEMSAVREASAAFEELPDVQGTDDVSAGSPDALKKDIAPVSDGTAEPTSILPDLSSIAAASKTAAQENASSSVADAPTQMIPQEEVRAAASVRADPNSFVPVERKTLDEILDEASKTGVEPRVAKDNDTDVTLVDFSDLL